MPSIEEKCRKLRVIEVGGSVLGSTRKLYRGIRTNRIFLLNADGVDYLVDTGHKFLTLGDQVQRSGEIPVHDNPNHGMIALAIITNLTFPVEDDPDRHLKYVEHFPVDADLFQ